MATRWSGSLMDLNAGNRGFVDIDRPEQVMEGDGEGVGIDHSILALFEDSTVESEGKNGADEDGAALLSALTEMLDNVAEEDDKTLSPFDTLPDTKLISITDCRDESLVKELSHAHRLRPRHKPPNATLTPGRDSEKEQRCRSDKKAQKLGGKHRKCEAKVEVFSSSSLVGLVRLMHSYCVKLHVEDSDEQKTGPTLFSQEEVWRYERPSEECEEEINVVSDDEAPTERTCDRQQLKSVLLKGNVSKEKKRVSFGPVQVTSYQESEENYPNEKNDLSETDLEPLTIFSAKCVNMTEVHPTKGGTKVKSLSLQQYRQLRQRTRPLVVEKQGNYTTKWPSVPVPPKELPPILCLQGQESNTNSHKVNYHSSYHGSKRSKSLKSVISPVKDINPKLSVRDGKRGPVLLCSDPPNPVLLPLTQSLLPSSSSQSRLPSVFLQEPQSECSAEPLPPPHTCTSHANRSPHNCNQSMAAAPQEVQTSLTDTDTHSGTTSGSPVHTQSAAEPHQRNSNPKTPSSPHPGSPKTSLFSALLSQPPALPPTASHTSMSEEPLSPPDEPSPPGNSCKQDRPATDSGIEACDLTSLLEQFEETQAKEARVCIQPKPVLCGSAFNQVQDASSETKSTSPSFIKPPESLETPETSRTQITPQQDPDLQSLGDEVVPEPLCTETIQSSQQDPPRRTPPPPKAIQIIHPRPLPSKRTHMSSTESPVARLPPHVFSYVSFEHDYCEPVGHPPTPQQNSSKDPRHLTAPQQNRSKDPRHPEQTSRPGSEASTEEALQTPPCSLPTPPPSPPVRGRRKRRYRSRSSRSDSSSSSCSSSSSSSSCSSACRSPKRPRLHRQSSQSSSCSSSPSSIDSPPRRNRLSYSKSRSSRSISRSWSQSRSPSRSPSPSQYACRRRWRDVCRESRRIRREHEIRMQKLRAIDERRVVYVGRIRTTMTHEELRDRFAQFGNVECVSLHFRDRGDHYGFVTFYNMEDAFAAIDNGSKLRKPDELPFDICFGGRRQFCNSNYADLDANRDTDQSPSKSTLDDLDFDSLLKQAQRGMKR